MPNWREVTGNVKNTRSMRLHPCDSILYTDLGAWSEVWTEGGKEKKKKTERELKRQRLKWRDGRERVSTGTDTLNLNIGLQISTGL